MVLKDWVLKDVTKNHKGVIIRKIWMHKEERSIQLNLSTIMPYAHVLSLMGWKGESLGTFETFNEGEKAAQKYMKSH